LVDEVLTKYDVQEDVTVRAVIRGGHETVYGSSGIQSNPEETPTTFWFRTAPNPFVTQTSIAFALPKQAMIKIAVYDVTGRQIVELVSGQHDPGYYTVDWHGTDISGRAVASGMYFVRCTAGDLTAQEKLLLVR
jgi:hypothetical protein